MWHEEEEGVSREKNFSIVKMRTNLFTDLIFTKKCFIIWIESGNFYSIIEAHICNNENNKNIIITILKCQFERCIIVIKYGNKKKPMKKISK